MMEKIFLHFQFFIVNSQFASLCEAQSQDITLEGFPHSETSG